MRDPSGIRRDDLLGRELTHLAQPNLSTFARGALRDRIGQHEEIAGGAVVHDRDARGHASERIARGKRRLLAERRAMIVG